MNSQIKPSKHFLIRGAIAIGLLVVILTVQTPWFKKLFDKKEKVVVVTTTVGDIVNADSNGNDIPDWQEKLWGLDPTVLYTNGVPNKQIIEDKKKAAGISDPSSDEVLNDTDRVARELFTLSTALGQSDEVDDQALRQITAKLGSSIKKDVTVKVYSMSDIKTTSTNLSTLTAYQNSLKKTFSNYDLNTPDIEVLLTAIANEDSGNLSQLTESAKTYTKLAESLKSINVPIGIAQDHISLLNGMSGVAISFSYLTQLDDNSVAALAGMAIYKNYSFKMNTAIDNINAYLSQYGIL